MVTTITLKNGEVWFMKYIHFKDEIERIPFQYSTYDQEIYMSDGIHELEKGSITIKNKKIIYMNE